MPKEIIFKKLEQIKSLLAELERLLKKPYRQFSGDLTILRAAERNFQLVVELACDINATLLIEKTGRTPDSYRESFSQLAKLNIFPGKTLRLLANSARLRNILTHEYDFEEDDRRFYDSASQMLPAYKEYLANIFRYVNET